MSNLRLRVISGVIMALVALAAVWIGGPVFTGFAAMVAVFVWSEWLEMTAAGRDDRAFLLSVIGIALAGLFVVFMSGWPMVLMVVLVWAVVCGAMILMGMGRSAMVGYAYCLLAMVSLSHLRGEMGSGSGIAAIVFLFAVVWATDVAAYFSGKAIGGPKLAPRISPGKTISGALGGVVGAVAAALIIYNLFDPTMSVWAAIVLALFASIFSQAGDLFESGLKRRASVKDSSTLIPGHGGVMDRVDGLVFAAVFVWLVALAVVGPVKPSIAFFW